MQLQPFTYMAVILFVNFVLFFINIILIFYTYCYKRLLYFLYVILKLNYMILIRTSQTFFCYNKNCATLTRSTQTQRSHSISYTTQSHFINTLNSQLYYFYSKENYATPTHTSHTSTSTLISQNLDYTTHPYFIYTLNAHLDKYIHPYIIFGNG